VHISELFLLLSPSPRQSDHSLERRMPSPLESQKRQRFLMQARFLARPLRIHRRKGRNSRLRRMPSLSNEMGICLCQKSNSKYYSPGILQTRRGLPGFRSITWDDNMCSRHLCFLHSDSPVSIQLLKLPVYKDAVFGSNRGLTFLSLTISTTLTLLHT